MAFLHLDTEVEQHRLLSAWALVGALLGWEGEVGFGAPLTTKIHVAVPWLHSVLPFPPEILLGHCFHVPVLCWHGAGTRCEL